MQSQAIDLLKNEYKIQKIVEKLIQHPLNGELSEAVRTGELLRFIQILLPKQTLHYNENAQDMIHKMENVDIFNSKCTELFGIPEQLQITRILSDQKLSLSQVIRILQEVIQRAKEKGILSDNDINLDIQFPSFSSEQIQRAIQIIKEENEGEDNIQKQKEFEEKMNLQDFAEFNSFPQQESYIQQPIGIQTIQQSTSPVPSNEQHQRQLSTTSQLISRPQINQSIYAQQSSFQHQSSQSQLQSQFIQQQQQQQTSSLFPKKQINKSELPFDKIRYTPLKAFRQQLGNRGRMKARQININQLLQQEQKIKKKKEKEKMMLKNKEIIEQQIRMNNDRIISQQQPTLLNQRQDIINLQSQITNKQEYNQQQVFNENIKKRETIIKDQLNYYQQNKIKQIIHRFHRPPFNRLHLSIEELLFGINLQSLLNQQQQFDNKQNQIQFSHTPKHFIKHLCGLSAIASISLLDKLNTLSLNSQNYINQLQLQQQQQQQQIEQQQIEQQQLIQQQQQIQQQQLIQQQSTKQQFSSLIPQSLTSQTLKQISLKPDIISLRKNLSYNNINNINNPVKDKQQQDNAEYKTEYDNNDELSLSEEEYSEQDDGSQSESSSQSSSGSDNAITDRQNINNNTNMNIKVKQQNQRQQQGNIKTNENENKNNMNPASKQNINANNQSIEYKYGEQKERKEDKVMDQKQQYKTDYIHPRPHPRIHNQNLNIDNTNTNNNLVSKEIIRNEIGRIKHVFDSALFEEDDDDEQDNNNIPINEDPILRDRRIFFHNLPSIISSFPFLSPSFTRIHSHPYQLWKEWRFMLKEEDQEKYNKEKYIKDKEKNRQKYQFELDIVEQKIDQNEEEEEKYEELIEEDNIQEEQKQIVEEENPEQKQEKERIKEQQRIQRINEQYYNASQSKINYLFPPLPIIQFSFVFSKQQIKEQQFKFRNHINFYQQINPFIQSLTKIRINNKAQKYREIKELIRNGEMSIKKNINKFVRVRMNRKEEEEYDNEIEEQNEIKLKDQQIKRSKSFINYQGSEMDSFVKTKYRNSFNFNNSLFNNNYNDYSLNQYLNNDSFSIFQIHQINQQQIQDDSIQNIQLINQYSEYDNNFEPKEQIQQEQESIKYNEIKEEENKEFKKKIQQDEKKKNKEERRLLKQKQKELKQIENEKKKKEKELEKEQKKKLKEQNKQQYNNKEIDQIKENDQSNISNEQHQQVQLLTINEINQRKSQIRKPRLFINQSWIDYNIVSQDDNNEITNNTNITDEQNILPQPLYIPYTKHYSSTHPDSERKRFALDVLREIENQKENQQREEIQQNLKLYLQQMEQQQSSQQNNDNMGINNLQTDSSNLHKNNNSKINSLDNNKITDLTQKPQIKQKPKIQSQSSSKPKSKLSSILISLHSSFLSKNKFQSFNQILDSFLLQKKQYLIKKKQFNINFWEYMREINDRLELIRTIYPEDDNGKVSKGINLQITSMINNNLNIRQQEQEKVKEMEKQNQQMQKSVKRIDNKLSETNQDNQVFSKQLLINTNKNKQIQDQQQQIQQKDKKKQNYILINPDMNLYSDNTNNLSQHSSLASLQSNQFFSSQSSHNSQQSQTNINEQKQKSQISSQLISTIKNNNNELLKQNQTHSFSFQFPSQSTNQKIQQKQQIIQTIQPQQTQTNNKKEQTIERSQSSQSLTSIEIHSQLSQQQSSNQLLNLTPINTNYSTLINYSSEIPYFLRIAWRAWIGYRYLIRLSRMEFIERQKHQIINQQKQMQLQRYRTKQQQYNIPLPSSQLSSIVQIQRLRYIQSNKSKLEKPMNITPQQIRHQTSSQSIQRTKSPSSISLNDTYQSVNNYKNNQYLNSTNSNQILNKSIIKNNKTVEIDEQSAILEGMIQTMKWKQWMNEEEIKLIIREERELELKKNQKIINELFTRERMIQDTQLQLQQQNRQTPINNNVQPPSNRKSQQQEKQTNLEENEKSSAAEKTGKLNHKIHSSSSDSQLNQINNPKFSQSIQNLQIFDQNLQRDPTTTPSKTTSNIKERRNTSIQDTDTFLQDDDSNLELAYSMPDLDFIQYLSNTQFL